MYQKARERPARKTERKRKMKKEKLRKRAVKGKPLTDPKEAQRKIREWMCSEHPEERTLLYDFRKDVTFAEVNRRMHKGENFYDICKCDESEQRIKVFEEMARIYKTTYDYWYYLWLYGGPKDPMLDKALKALKKNKKLKHLFKRG